MLALNMLASEADIPARKTPIERLKLALLSALHCKYKAVMATELERLKKDRTTSTQPVSSKVYAVPTQQPIATSPANICARFKKKHSIVTLRPNPRVAKRSPLVAPVQAASNASEN
jgi:hypothetical protein